MGVANEWSSDKKVGVVPFTEVLNNLNSFMKFRVLYPGYIVYRRVEIIKKLPHLPPPPTPPPRSPPPTPKPVQVSHNPQRNYSRMSSVEPSDAIHDENRRSKIL